MKIILINNKFTDTKDAKISIFSESFEKGYGVFESFRTFHNKKLFQEKEHINRLFNSAKKINLKIKYSKEEIFKMLLKVIKKSPYKIQKLKIIATQEDLIIYSIKFKENKTLQKKGVSCMTIECVRSLPEIKSLSYLECYLSHEKAISKNYFDAILIDENKEVFEGAYSNIFWFEKDILCTRKEKILPGVTRKTILKISPFKIKFKTIKLNELLKKKEIFLTQSTQGIIPITKINKTKINNGEVGKNTIHLIKILNKYN